MPYEKQNTEAICLYYWGAAEQIIHFSFTEAQFINFNTNMDLSNLQEFK